MAKITVVGDAVVITSDVKFEDIQKVEKYRPKELTLYGGEDGKEPIFRIGTTSNVGRINEYGAEFGGTARDGSGKATITTVIMGEGSHDIKEAIADTYGVWVSNLSKIEEKIAGILEEIDAERARIMENIEVQ